MENMDAEHQLYMYPKSNGNIISVDSSEDWINKIKEELKDRETKIDLKFIDLGITKEWGRLMIILKRKILLNI